MVSQDLEEAPELLDHEDHLATLARLANEEKLDLEEPRE